MGHNKTNGHSNFIGFSDYEKSMANYNSEKGRLAKQKTLTEIIEGK